MGVFGVKKSFHVNTCLCGKSFLRLHHNQGASITTLITNTLIVNILKLKLIIMRVKKLRFTPSFGKINITISSFDCNVIGYRLIIRLYFVALIIEL